jgi:hypothetical protein
MSDKAAVIGAFVLIGACAAIVALVTKTYRESMALAAAVITSEPGAPLELVCGIRLGLLNATWPGGRCRFSDDGVAFSCLGIKRQASWTDVRAVEMVKPFNLIGWGVRFRIPAMKPGSVIVWLGSRQLAERLIETCKLHQVPATQKPRIAL